MVYHTLIYFTIWTNITSSHLGQLLGDVATHKDSLQVDPEVLDDHPVLDDLRRVRQVLYPRLDLLLEWRVVPAVMKHLFRNI